MWNPPVKKRRISAIVKGFWSFSLRGSTHRWRRRPGVQELTASGYYRQMDVRRDDEMRRREGDRVMQGEIVPDVVIWMVGTGGVVKMIRSQLQQQSEESGGGRGVGGGGFTQKPSQREI